MVLDARGKFETGRAEAYSIPDLEVLAFMFKPAKRREILFKRGIRHNQSIMIIHCLQGNSRVPKSRKYLLLSVGQEIADLVAQFYLALVKSANESHTTSVVKDQKQTELQIWA